MYQKPSQIGLTSKAGFEEKDKEMKERQREKYDQQYRVHPIYSNTARWYSSMAQHPRLSIKSLAELSDIPAHIPM